MTITRRGLLGATGAAGIAALAGCSGSSTPEATQGSVQVSDTGASRVAGPQLRTQLDALPVEELSAAEVAGIRFMREEEKLAHDLYTALGAQTGHQIFTNIAASEQTHTDAMALLLDRYAIADPHTGVIGRFSDPDLQALYGTLRAEGAEGPIAALEVGALVEEVDILDIEGYLQQTDAPAIELVYGNLLMGSRNHLRAFTRTLERSGVTYTPARLDPAAYAAIVESPFERGAGSGTMR